MKKIFSVLALAFAFATVMPVLARAKDDYPPDGDFKKYAKLATATWDKADANNCAAYDEAMSYWLKAYNEAVTHLNAARNNIEHELSTVRNPGNRMVVEGTREVYAGLLLEEKSIINWQKVKYDLLYDATEKGCKMKFVDEGPLK